jgi:hypothetical protein
MDPADLATARVPVIRDGQNGGFGESIDRKLINRLVT